MKLIFTILFFISLQAGATTYYVATAGNDANNGTSIVTPWKTISKVVSSVVSNDSVFFNKGDVWNERFLPPFSNLYFGAYGTGVKPVITAFQAQSGFTNVGNVWTATATNSVPVLNTVLINGIFAAKGRFPNTGYLTYKSGGTTTKIIGTLTGFPDYSGSELVVRSAPWVTDVVKIASQVADTFNLASAMTYPPALNANGYFIQNSPLVLDTLNEWAYDSTTRVLKVYQNTSPTVLISTIDTLVWLRSKNNITFSGLSFQGANKKGFQLDTSNNISIVNCSFRYCGIAVAASKSKYCTVSKDSIQDSYTGGIYLVNFLGTGSIERTCDSSTVTDNYIRNTGAVSGMGENGVGKYEGIYIVGLATNILRNKIVNTGYIGINFNGKNSVVKNNYIDTFCFVKCDGGGIYTWNGNGYYPFGYSDSSVIRSNIVTNGVASAAGISIPPISPGIYLDNQTRRITVDSNTVSNTVFGGIYLNQDSSIRIYDNLIIDTLASCLISSATVLSDLTIKRNVAFSQDASQFVFYNQSSFFSGDFIDSNYYLRPAAETNKFKWSSTTYSLPGWITATGYDTNSKETPSGINSTNFRLVINPTSADSTVNISGSYLDAKGTLTINSILLHAYGSALLFKTTNDIYLRSRSGINILKFVNQ